LAARDGASRLKRAGVGAAVLGEGKGRAAAVVGADASRGCGGCGVEMWRRGRGLTSMFILRFSHFYYYSKIVLLIEATKEVHQMPH
jgi:hypothetical protein